jgi:hypothetical protein
MNADSGRQNINPLRSEDDYGAIHTFNYVRNRYVNYASLTGERIKFSEVLLVIVAAAIAPNIGELKLPA